MANNKSLRVLAIATASIIVCCLAAGTLGLHCIEQRNRAASRPLKAGFNFGSTNFKIDPLVGNVVFSRGAQTREQSMKLLIQQAMPIHVSQLELLAKCSNVIFERMRSTP